MSSQNNKDPRWIMSKSGMVVKRGKQKFRINGNKDIVLSKRWREMLETLREGPVYCASPVRLSDAVCVLRRDYGVPIETLTTEEGRKFYALECDVREVAA